MEIPQEVIGSGVFTAYADTDPELVISVENYNLKMERARVRKLKLRLLERMFLLLNVILLIVPGMIPKGVIFILKPRIVWLEWAALAVYAAAFFYFGAWRKKFILLTVFSALLLLCDARYGIMIAVNAVLTVFREKEFRSIKGREGYPYFRRIRIEKMDCNKPSDVEKTNEENFDKPLDKSQRM